MKNIHVLPTDKASNLLFEKISNRYYTNSRRKENTKNVQNQNIYITSEEEIKEGEYQLYNPLGNFDNAKVSKAERLLQNDGRRKKIILTTDVDLIEDGVQAIDNEFLEWFVKNPSCEEVEVKSEILYQHKETYRTYPSECNNLTKTKVNYYLSTIPKEEPKQFKGRGMLHYSGKIIGGEPKQENTAEYIDRHIVEAMVEVVKQKMYNEEEVEDLIYKVCGTVARLQGITLNGNHIDTAYKQFKKK